MINKIKYIGLGGLTASLFNLVLYIWNALSIYDGWISINYDILELLPRFMLVLIFAFVIIITSMIGGSPESDYDTGKNNNEELIKKLEFQSSLLNMLQESVVVTDINGIVTYWNSYAEKLYGWSSDEVIGKHISEVKPMLITETQIEDMMKKMIAGEKWTGKFCVKKKDRSDVHVMVTNSPIYNDSNELTHVISLSLDISDNIEMENKLKDSEDNFKLLAEGINDIFWIATPDLKKLLYISPSYKKYWADSIDKLNKNPKSFIDIIIPEDRKLMMKRIEKKYFLKEWEHEYRIKSKGKIYWLRDRGFPIKDENGEITKLAGILTDITKHKDYEEKIKEALKEKDILLQEIHHRVKNNLQIVTSIMNLQLNVIEDELLKNIVEEMKNRVYAIALIHEKLYSSRNFINIDVNDYFTSLINNLISSFDYKNNIKIDIDLPDGTMEIDMLNHISLIINELISNSIKHAFKDFQTDKQIIGFKIQSNDNKDFKLLEYDNGKGLPEGFEIENAKTLGLRLVNITIIALNGSIKLKKYKDSGTMIEISVHKIGDDD